MSLDTSALGRSSKTSWLDATDVSVLCPQKAEVDDLEGECVHFPLVDVFNAFLYAKFDQRKRG